MALFQATSVIPDVRSGIGAGVIDASQDMVVSWRINGQSAMTSYAITIMVNDATSTQKYTTGQISTGCPAYGTDTFGNPQMFSYTIPAATLSSSGITNGGEYKLVITQWWSANDSVTQTSASVFITRKAPTLSISAIGTSSVISTRYYTFVGNYAQAQGDTLNWFRWQLATSGNTDNPFYDTGDVVGTANMSLYYDGFFSGSSYAVRLTCQTENGIEADTGWVSFSCLYSVPATTGGIAASCVKGTDAVLVEWTGIGAFPGTASGFYSIGSDYSLTLANGDISWKDGVLAPMSFASPWSILWKGTLGNRDATIFSVEENGSDITLSYDYANSTIILSQGGTEIVSQSGITNAPTVTAILTPTMLYLRVFNTEGGLYPADSLLPDNAIYPDTGDELFVDVYGLDVTYQQITIDAVSIGAYQICSYIEIQKGVVDQSTITAAITNGTYYPAPNANDYMMANWHDGINAGTLDIGGDTVIGFAIYRLQQNSTLLEKVAETDVETSELYDYGSASQQGAYTYYIFPVGQNTYIASPIISESINPCWWNWTLMECEETDDRDTFTVLAAYRFKYNIETGAMTNNNSPTVLKNFTPYPKIQLAPQNYKSASLSGLIGAIDWTSGQPEYKDTLQLRDAIYALSLTQNPLFLKNRKGDLLRVQIIEPISMQTSDATQEQMQTMTLKWAEVGSAKGVSLYALENKGVFA